MKLHRSIGIGVLFAGLMLAGCLGGESNSGSNATDNLAVGRVAVLMTDAPVAADAFAHVYLTVTAVALLDADDAGESSGITIFHGEETVDLLNLANHSELFALTNALSGDYEKIRLTVSKIELVKVTGESTTESHYPHLPGNGKIDLIPRGTIHVDPDRLTLVQVDVDAEKSIHIVRRGNKDEYNFRPVIFVDVLTDDFPGKLVRHRGYVDELNAAAGTFELCEVPLAEQPADAVRDCLGIAAADASVFAANGTPTTTSALVNDQFVAVVGFFGVVESPPASPLVMSTKLNAEVVEIGDGWKTYRGAVGTAPESATGTFIVLPDSATPLTAQLQVGTKVFARDGTPLDLAAITPDAEVALDGATDAGATLPIKTALVVVNDHEKLATLNGSVWSVDYATRNIAVMPRPGVQAEGDPPWMPTPPTGVTTDDDTLVFRISESDEVISNTLVSFDGITVNDRVTVYGHFEIYSFKAEVVVIDATGE
jgi:hypothetical protein